MMGDNVQAHLITQLDIDNKAMRVAGNNLAIAALRVINNYDGLHRLSLAVSEWATVIANEGGRPHNEVTATVGKRSEL